MYIKFFIQLCLFIEDLILTKLKKTVKWLTNAMQQYLHIKRTLHTFKITNSYHITQVTIRGPYNQCVSYRTYRTQNNEEMS